MKVQLPNGHKYDGEARVALKDVGVAGLIAQLVN